MAKLSLLVSNAVLLIWLTWAATAFGDRINGHRRQHRHIARTVNAFSPDTILS